MDRKKLVLLLGALIIAVGTAFAARTMFAGGTAAPEAVAAEPVGPKVLVAKLPLPAGTIITAEALEFQSWPEGLVQDAYYLEGESDVSGLLGTVVRDPLTVGEPVTQGTLVSPGDRGFLAAALGPGMRAVTVPVSAKTGVAGFVFPGDRVDVVLTQTVPGEGRPLNAAETVLRNLRVLATDQSTEQFVNENGKTQVRAFRTVTLEVTPKLAEKVTVAMTIGQLTLVLRSIADNQAELERAIASGDITIPEDASPEEEERILRAAMARPADKGTTFATGGDVSRFQRKTVPPSPEEVEARERAERAAAAADDRRAGALNGTAGPIGPKVRVTRGQSTAEVVVDPQAGSTASLISSQSNGVRNAGQTVPAVTSSLIR
ncbi:Flp pilus assembly protein CpaB [Erythrobacter sp. YT30]|uniref:Flp pilus assembly protein CpaB n=1 Tax=Erythrobacter sp. YT30 TaxID=1735012 RepID=UPI00076C274E|nr:Flp pilus assembly protein CpaB [Erythrobacter sp. YT30]KWV90375.1 pilus assembly protein CpaB [Erythrobacter sp. YT30]